MCPQYGSAHDPSLTDEVPVDISADIDLNQTVLMVDDNADNLLLLEAILSEEACHLHSARSGPECLDYLKSNRVSLILLDIQMPGMDGLEVARRVRSVAGHEKTPIIFITAGLRRDQKVADAYAAGAVDFIYKPIDVAIVRAKVQVFLTLDSQHLALERQAEQVRDQLAALRRSQQQLRASHERILQLAVEKERLKSEAKIDRLQSVAEMVAGVAHEVNTPLGVVTHAASFLSELLPQLHPVSAQDPAQQEVYADLLEASDLIQGGVRSASRIISSFKKLSVWQVTEHEEEVNLLDLLAEVRTLYRVQAGRSALEVEIPTASTQSDDPPTWLGFPGYLVQILQNLLSNCERYAYPNGSGLVTISLDQTTHVELGEIFLITVRDYGVGIPEQNLDRIFDPFFTTGRGRGGTGLGLSIAFNLATGPLKGRIRVDSNDTTGTAFAPSLPRNPPAMPPHPLPSEGM